MRNICLIFLVGEGFDCSAVFEQAFKTQGYLVETVRIPNRWIHLVDRTYLNELRALIKQKSKNHFVIFSPQSTELFLPAADLTILYSAYRSWYDPRKMRVIPHLWTPIKPPETIERLTWTGKPPLRVGFMGRDYTNSRLANFVLKFPAVFKRWLLRAPHLRHPQFVSLMNGCGISAGAINTFARIETINALLARRNVSHEMELDIVTKERFGGSGQELQRFADHLERNTYILCPRGTENYSYRIYETLSRGRIPVIIDSDTVLPQEIDWDYLSIRIPYESIDQINEIISCDYDSRSESNFIARQKAAFSPMAELQNMRWVKDIVTGLKCDIDASFES